jgi:hypothetical protein
LAVSHLDPFLLAAEQSGFAFYLTKGLGSKLHIGGPDPSFFDYNYENVEYHSILEHEYDGKKPSYWMIGDGKIRVNGKIVVSGISTIIDSGTDMILGPMGSVTTIYTDIRHREFRVQAPLQESYVLPCNSKFEDIPEITFSWGAEGKEWPIDRER